MMAGVLNRSEGISYDATISYATGSEANVVMKHATVSATLERYAKMLITTSVNGSPTSTVSASGAAFTLYDAVAGKYIVVTTSEDRSSMVNALQLAGKAVFPVRTDSSEATVSATGFPMIYFNQVYDLSTVAAGSTLVYAMTSSTTTAAKTVNNVTLTLTTPRYGSVMLTYFIDPESHLPSEFSEVVTRLNKPAVTVLQQIFTDFKVIRTPLSATTYAYTPPATAVLVKVQQ